MRNILFAITVLLLTGAECAGVESTTLDIREVSISVLSRVIFKDRLKVNYVLAPDVLSSGALLSLSLNGQSNKSLLETMRESLSLAGFSMERRGGVYYIDGITDAKAVEQTLPGQKEGAEKDQSENQYFTYQAKARPLAYLTRLAKFAGAQIVEGDAAGDVLVYSASEPIRKRLEEVLRVVDVPAKAITIKAALIEYSDTTDKGNSFGLTVLSKRLKSTYNAGATLANSVTFIGATVQAALSAIDGDSRFTYLSQPMLRVLDGENAKLSVGTDVPVRGAVTTDKNGNNLQSVEYRSSGVILNVSPKIVGDLITLKIDQQISSFGLTTTSNIDSPSLFKRQASTTVDIKKGQLIVLAGLDEDKETKAHSGVSFMPNWAWSDTNNKTKSQVLLLLEVLEDAAI